MDNNAGNGQSRRFSWITTTVIASSVLIMTILGMGAFTTPEVDATYNDLSLQPQISQEIRELVNQTISADSLRDVPKIQAVDIIGPVDGYTIQIRFAISGDGSGYLSSDGIGAEVRNICESIFESELPINSVILTATYPVAQTYGPATETAVFKGVLSAAAADTIKWNSLPDSEIINLMESAWLHTTVSR